MEQQQQQQQQQQSAALEQPRRLELSLNPADGSLRTAPLSQVLLAATDDLYTDLYNMAAGELDVVTAAAALTDPDQSTDPDPLDDNNNNAQQQQQQQQLPIAATTKKERMSNLSFAQRRHELAWRLSRHGKTLQHVAALTAAAATTDLAPQVHIGSTALQHTRTSWNQADEAQDALYFFHAQLFPRRLAPHDVYGAADLQCGVTTTTTTTTTVATTTTTTDRTTTSTTGTTTGTISTSPTPRIMMRLTWYDLCRDLQLTVDPYESSPEATWTAAQVDQVWQMAVRRKLITGEVGWMMRRQQQQHHKQQQQQQQPLWKVSLRGGVVRLTQGRGKPVVNIATAAAQTNDTTTPSQTTERMPDNNNNSLGGVVYEYPMEALLTVFPSHYPEWTLLSISVKVQAKTGESNHQLETSNRQCYDLHRLAALAMSREEVRARMAAAAASTVSDQDAMEDTLTDNGGTATTTTTAAAAATRLPPARPLRALFQVAHRFALSWQLEVLSAQAQGLRRGAWAAGTDIPIHVTPVRFLEEQAAARLHSSDSMEDDGDSDDDENNDDVLLGIVSISFWRVDDSYGPPAMADLCLKDETSTGDLEKEYRAQEQLQRRIASLCKPDSTSQLILSIRAHANTGIKVALSGASGILGTTKTDPRVRSTVQELLEATSNPIALSASDALLAATKLCAERKCYAVVAALQPHDPIQNSNSSSSSPNILPHWIALSVEHESIAVSTRIQYHGIETTTATADSSAKHGTMPILFRLMCDARTGSFVQTFPRSLQLLRRLVCNDAQSSEPVAIRVASLPPNRQRAAVAHSSGRSVRDAFFSLVRSMNVLGQRVAVGGAWDDLNPQSFQLRQRSVQQACADVRASLVKSCALAALYGLAPLALASAIGLDATPDMTGGVMESIEGVQLLPVPPLSIRMHQELVETATTTSDGVSTNHSYVQETLFSLSCFVGENGPVIVPMEISVKMDSPGALPRVQNSELLCFETPMVDISATNSHKGSNGNLPSLRKDDLILEAGRFAELLSNLIDSERDD